MRRAPLTRWKGRLQSGWIDDQSTPVADLFGRLPDSQRSFVTGDINGRTADGLEIAGNLFAQTDPDVLRDFRPFLIGQAGNPQLNLEVVRPYEGGYLSAALTAKADNYQDVVQKLPEFRYDLPTTIAGDDGWSRRAFLSVGYFSERPSAELNVGELPGRDSCPPTLGRPPASTGTMASAGRWSPATG